MEDQDLRLEIMLAILAAPRLTCDDVIALTEKYVQYVKEGKTDA